MSVSTLLSVGDKAKVEIDFPKAKAGDKYIVDVQIKEPNGVINSEQITYEFVSNVSRREPKTRSFRPINNLHRR